MDKKNYFYRHGDTGTRLHRTWHSMKARCRIPSATGYATYGGRGIDYCAEWEDYATFKEWALSHGYEDGLQLDRIHNDRGYHPNNCRFVTNSQNQRNKNTNWKITAFGETKILIEWAEDPRAVTSAEIISERIRRGIDPETAITFKGQAYSPQKLVPAK